MKSFSKGEDIEALTKPDRYPLHRPRPRRYILLATAVVLLNRESDRHQSAERRIDPPYTAMQL
jgi:hypothetical protein